MLTNPNTLGLFDENIDEIAAIVHGVGGTLYYDGANLNAIMGWTRPATWASTSFTSTSTSRSASRPATAGRRPDRGLGADRPVPAGAEGRSARELQRLGAELRARR